MPRPIHYLLLAILMLLFGCGGEPESPETRLRGLIGEAEAALESRDLARVMEFVDPAYRDEQGRDRAQLRGLLAGYFLRHPSIHILSKIDLLEIRAQDDAFVLAYAGVAGSPQEAEAPLSQWRGRLLRLELDFKRDDEGEWRLRKAAWRSARREDFAP